MQKLTKKMCFYLFKFALRLILFGIMIVLYIKDKVRFYQYTITSIKDGINFMHLMWAVFMCLMISHIFPTKVISMGCGKLVKSNFVPVPNYSETKLMQFVHERNIKAWKSMIVWLSGNFVIGILYFLKIIGNAEILFISGFYFISDYICILIFCPFQTFIQKNKCCVNCRIYDWGHFMMFTPMILLRTFYGWTLFFMGAVVIIRWEYMLAKYPERFWEGSNQTLRCENCKDKTCYTKKETAKNFAKVFKIK
ncbi:MAG: hypothetical protein K2K91_08835 [Ruminococcus sp.]|nr:hypothetical protein [Ruminococcus sp.]